jgi:hypothetical protein
MLQLLQLGSKFSAPRICLYNVFVVIKMIWAEDLGSGIGKDNKIPWHISEDFQHF